MGDTAQLTMALTLALGLVKIIELLVTKLVKGSNGNRVHLSTADMADIRNCVNEMRRFPELRNKAEDIESSLSKYIAALGNLDQYRCRYRGTR